MNDETKQDKLIAKIRALKAKADDPSTTEAESMAFAAKVAELLAAHGLEEAQLATEQQEELGHEDHVADWNNSPARRALVIALCRLYFVKPLIRRKKGLPWTLIGRKHNVIMVKEMAEYLINTTIRLGNQYRRANPGSTTGDVTDFKRGCFARITERITDLYWQQARKTTPTYTPQGNPGNLPALYKNDRALAEAYVQRVFGKVGTFNQKQIKQGVHAMAGRAAGDKVSLNRQVGSGNGGGNLLPGRK